MAEIKAGKFTAGDRVEITSGKYRQTKVKQPPRTAVVTRVMKAMMDIRFDVPVKKMVGPNIYETRINMTSCVLIGHEGAGNKKVDEEGNEPTEISDKLRMRIMLATKIAIEEETEMEVVIREMMKWWTVCVDEANDGHLNNTKG